MLHSARRENQKEDEKIQLEFLIGSLSQVNKRKRWMPWQSKAMKDVVACEKLRGAGKQALIRRSLNGETHSIFRVSATEYIGCGS